MGAILICRVWLGNALRAAGVWLFRKGGWKPALIGLLALLGAYFVWTYRNMRADRDAAVRAAQDATAQTELLRTSTIAASRAVIGTNAAKAAINHKEAAGLARTETALDANPDWAQQPVPVDVLDSLRD